MANIYSGKMFHIYCVVQFNGPFTTRFVKNTLYRYTHICGTVLLQFSSKVDFIDKSTEYIEANSDIVLGSNILTG